LNELVVESKERVDPGALVAHVGRCAGRVHQKHATDFDFAGVGSASTMGTSTEHGRSGVVSCGSHHMSVGMGTDSAAGEAVVRKHHGSSVVDVVTQEHDTMVVERSSVSGVPGEDGRGVTHVDVVGVSLDGVGLIQHKDTVGLLVSLLENYDYFPTGLI
jgi:hypothetical protein